MRFIESDSKHLREPYEKCLRKKKSVCARFFEESAQNLRKNAKYARLWRKMREICANLFSFSQNCAKLLENLCEINFFNVNFYRKIQHKKIAKYSE